MNSKHASLRVLGMFVVTLAIVSACSDDRDEPAAGVGGIGGVDGTGDVGGGGLGGAGGMSGTGGTYAGDGAGLSGTGGVGGVGGVGGIGGIGGTGGTGGGDAGTSMACPSTFECVTEPIFNLLSACLPMGGGLPPECTVDADCVAAGLTDGICLMEMELGVAGCLQICTP